MDVEQTFHQFLEKKIFVLPIHTNNEVEQSYLAFFEKFSQFTKIRTTNKPFIVNLYLETCKKSFVFTKIGMLSQPKSNKVEYLKKKSYMLSNKPHEN